MKTTFENISFIKYCLTQPLRVCLLFIFISFSSIGVDQLINNNSSRKNIALVNSKESLEALSLKDASLVNFYSSNLSWLQYNNKRATASTSQSSSENAGTGAKRIVAYVDLQLKLARKILELNFRKD